jgi:uncharacterized protein (TIGR02271 family)
MVVDYDDGSPARAVVLPLLEEESQVNTRETVTGRVRIRTVTDTVQDDVQRELSGERVTIEHVPINRYVEDGALPGIRMERDTMVVPIVQEVLVVEKRLVLTEELHITRHTEQVTAEVPVTLRKQRAVIERLEGESGLAQEKTNQQAKKE